MPSSTVLRRSSTTATTTVEHRPPLPSKRAPLPQPLIRELALHAPSLLASPAPETLHKHHCRRVGPGQACSAVVRAIAAPVEAVWSVVRRFEDPLPYKRFLKSCQVVCGDAQRAGALREVRVVSGLPASCSTERLDVIDDERHVVGFSVVGGEHRLKNYRSVTTLHDLAGVTVVVESYVVDVPPENTADETCVFADTIVRCNLHSLAQVAESMMSR